MLEHGFARPTVSSFPRSFHACRLWRQAWKKRNILAEWSKSLNSRHSERSEESSLGRDSGKILRCAQNDRCVVLQTAKQLRKNEIVRCPNYPA